jgi:hypothetical protein
MLRLDGICVIVTNVATRREDLYQKYFYFLLLLYRVIKKSLYT